MSEPETCNSASEFGSTESPRTENPRSRSARKGLAWIRVGLWMFFIELPLLLSPYISLLAQWFMTPVVAIISMAAIAKSLSGLDSDRREMAKRALMMSIPVAAISVAFTIYAWNQGIGL